MTSTLLYDEIAELSKAIGDRSLEVKFGRQVIVHCALTDLEIMTEALLAKVKIALLPPEGMKP